MTDWNDPVIQGAAPDDTLCQWCRAEHPRPDSGLENIPFGANTRGSAMPETWPAGNAEVVRAAPSQPFVEDPRD